MSSSVEISPYIAGVVALIAIGTAHIAGAGYVIAEGNGKSNRSAIVRSVISVALVLLAIHLKR
jgi:TctA family transporter